MGSQLGGIIMFTTILTLLLAFIAGSVGSDGQTSFAKTDHAFRAYMGDLAELAQRWQQTAELIDARGAAGARAILSAPLPEALDHVWADRQDTLRSKAKVYGFYEEEWIRQHHCYALGRWLLDAGRPTLAAARLRGCTPPWQAYQRQEFDRHYARALFESGRFAEAADRLAALDTTGWSTGPLEEHAAWTSGTRAKRTRKAKSRDMSLATRI